MQSDYINIIDCMAVVKKLKVKSNLTFKEVSEKLLDEILKTSRNASQIYAIFGVHKTDSIKMQSESEDHLDNYIFTPLLHHKK